MATHSSVLAWRIPGTGEPGGLGGLWLYGSMGSHRVWDDWSDLAAVAATTFSYENFLISWGGINLSILCAFGISGLCISYSIPASYSINVPSCSFFHFFVSVHSLKTVTMSSVFFTCRYLINLGCKDILIGVFAYNNDAIDFYKKNNYHTRYVEMTKEME